MNCGQLENQGLRWEIGGDHPRTFACFLLMAARAAHPPRGRNSFLNRIKLARPVTERRERGRERRGRERASPHGCNWVSQRRAKTNGNRLGESNSGIRSAICVGEKKRTYERDATKLCCRFFIIQNDSRGETCVMLPISVLAPF